MLVLTFVDLLDISSVDVKGSNNEKSKNEAKQKQITNSNLSLSVFLNILEKETDISWIYLEKSLARDSTSKCLCINERVEL